MFQTYKFNFATENSEQLLTVFVSGSLVMTIILNTTFVLCSLLSVSTLYTSAPKLHQNI